MFDSMKNLPISPEIEVNVPPQSMLNENRTQKISN